MTNRMNRQSEESAEIVEEPFRLQPDTFHSQQSGEPEMEVKLKRLFSTNSLTNVEPLYGTKSKFELGQNKSIKPNVDITRTPSDRYETNQILTETKRKNSDRLDAGSLEDDTSDSISSNHQNHH